MSFRLLTAERNYSAAQVLQLLKYWPAPSMPAEARLNPVAIQSPNSAAFVLRLLTLWSRHTLVLPLDPKIPSAEVARILAQILPPILAQEALPTAETAHTLSNDLQAALNTMAQIMQNMPTASDDEAENSDLENNKPEQLMPLEQPASLIRTSGSSAYPKLAQHSWGNHVYSAQGSLQTLPLNVSDRWLLSLPLFHVGGLAIVVRCWLAGAALAIPAAAQSLAEAVLYFEPTHLSLVPTQLQRLLEDPETCPALQKCQAILLGGAPVSADLIQKAQRAKLNIHTSYGSTEMSSQITTTPSGYWRQRSSSPVVSGELLPHRELRLQAGEIQVRGKTLFQGYLQSGSLHRPLSEHWFATGDLGHWHAGQLQITGRKDYQFISGGENIQPEEVERHLLGFSEIQEAMVVAVNDREFGARPVAFLRLAEGIETSAFCAKLPAALSLHLPKFKIPLVFHPWPKSLQTDGLKPRRKDFQAYAENLSPLP